MYDFAPDCNAELSLTELANTSCEDLELTAAERADLSETGPVGGFPDDFHASYAEYLAETEKPVTDEDLDAMWAQEMERRDAERDGGDDDRTPPAAPAALPAPATAVAAVAPAAFRQVDVAGRKFAASVQYGGRRYRLGKHATEAAAWHACDAKLAALRAA